MNDNGRINRRDFIKSSVLTGGVLLAQAAIPVHAMNFLSEKSGDKNDMFANDGLVKGVCDIHLHCRPDSRERSVDEYGFMRDAMRAGYRHLMLHTTTNVKVGKGKVFPCWLITDRYCPKSSA